MTNDQTNENLEGVQKVVTEVQEGIPGVSFQGGKFSGRSSLHRGGNEDNDQKAGFFRLDSPMSGSNPNGRDNKVKYRYTWTTGYWRRV